MQHEAALDLVRQAFGWLEIEEQESCFDLLGRQYYFALPTGYVVDDDVFRYFWWREDQTQKDREFSEDERAVRRANSTRLGTIQHTRKNPARGGGWSGEDLALLAIEGLTDEEIAQRIGRTSNAVRVKRWRLYGGR